MEKNRKKKMLPGATIYNEQARTHARVIQPSRKINWKSLIGERKRHGNSTRAQEFPWKFSKEVRQGKARKTEVPYSHGCRQNSSLSHHEPYESGSLSKSRGLLSVFLSPTVIYSCFQPIETTLPASV